MATDFLWHGRAAARAARAGLKAGVLAFAVPIVLFHGYLGTECGTATVLIVNALTGLGVGVLLSVQALRLAGRCDAYLLGAGLLVVLSGPIGVASMAAGYVVSTTPVMVCTSLR